MEGWEFIDYQIWGEEHRVYLKTEKGDKWAIACLLFKPVSLDARTFKPTFRFLKASVSIGRGEKEGFLYENESIGIINQLLDLLDLPPLDSRIDPKDFEGMRG